MYHDKSKEIYIYKKSTYKLKILKGNKQAFTNHALRIIFENTFHD